MIRTSRAVRALDPVVGAADRQLPAHVGLGLDGCRPVRSASPWSAQPAPPANPGRFRKTQAPSTTRVLRAPSSSVSVHASRLCRGVLLPDLRGELGDEALDPLARRPCRRSARRACSSRRVGLLGVDARAAGAEDAGPVRRQPGQVAAEDLVGVGRVEELDPRAREVQVDLGHVSAYVDALTRVEPERSPAGCERMPSWRPRRLGVLDVGSNTVHLLVVDAQPGCPPWPAYSYKTELRLAELHRRQGRIDGAGARPAGQDASPQPAGRRGPGRRGAARVRHVGSARGHQRPGRPDRVRQETGVDLQVLSGDDEARLTFLAVAPLVRLVGRSAARARHRRWLAGDRGRRRRVPRRGDLAAARRRSAHPRPARRATRRRPTDSSRCARRSARRSPRLDRRGPARRAARTAASPPRRRSGSWPASPAPRRRARVPTFRGVLRRADLERLGAAARRR